MCACVCVRLCICVCSGCMCDRYVLFMIYCTSTLIDF